MPENKMRMPRWTIAAGAAVGLLPTVLAGCGDPGPITISGNQNYQPTPTGQGYPGNPFNATPTTPGYPNNPGYPGSNTGSQSDIQMAPGQCETAQAGDIFLGDPKINGQLWTDSNPKSGQITVFDQSAQLCAPFGGDLQKGADNSPFAQNIINQDAHEMHQHGCENNAGCATVIVIRFPSGRRYDP